MSTRRQASFSLLGECASIIPEDKKIFGRLVSVLIGGSQVHARKARLIAAGFTIDFTACDNPKVKKLKAKEIPNDSAMKALDESGFVKSLGLK